MSAVQVLWPQGPSTQSLALLCFLNACWLFFMVGCPSFLLPLRLVLRGADLQVHESSTHHAVISNGSGICVQKVSGLHWG